MSGKAKKTHKWKKHKWQSRPDEIYICTVCGFAAYRPDNVKTTCEEKLAQDVVNAIRTMS